MADDWTQVFPVHAPSARFWHAVTYDNFRHRIVLFGGQTSIGATAVNDTWEWSGTDWVQKSPAHSPSARTAMGMAFDAINGVILIFGGYDGSGTLSVNNETWAWDGTDWTQFTPATSPPARFGCAMGRNYADDAIVMIGGRDNVGNGIGDTWTWDGANWTNALPATHPSTRFLGPRQLANDFVNNNDLFFGGQSGIGYFNDTWLWNTAAWIQQAPAHKPSPRQLVGLTEWTSNRVLLFGGADAGSWFGETWTWDGTDWTQATPAHSPSPRDLPGLAFNFSGQYALLFGGETTGVVANGETWLYHGPSIPFEVGLGYGGVAPQGGGDRTTPRYLQSALPKLDLTPGCTVALRAQQEDGSLRTLDSWSDVTLWVDDGS